MRLELRIAEVSLAVGALIAGAAPARAQTAQPLQNPSPRAAGMGGASAAVVWSGDLNPWANPALIGYTSGLTPRWSRASYWPDVAHSTASGIGYGWGGLGLSYDRDRIHAHFTDLSGQPLYEASWRLRRWGGGISLSHVLETVSAGRDKTSPGITRHADLAFGFARKRAEIDLPPSPADETASAIDFGLLARVTPLPDDRDGSLVLDLTYGYAELKEPMDRLTFPSSTSTPRHRRHGIGVRAGLPLSPRDSPGFGRGMVNWLARGSDPTVALTLAADFDRFEGRQGVFSIPPPGESRDIGGELELANTLAFRFGHVRDDPHSLDGFCFGFGIAPPIADFARVRYDYARFPHYDGKHNRHAFSAWIDPIALMRR